MTHSCAPLRAAVSHLVGRKLNVVLVTAQQRGTQIAGLDSSVAHENIGVQL